MMMAMWSTMAWLTLAVESALATAAARPHILMMLADDWGSYDASWRMKELGREPDIHTKNIDALSAGGIRFANYYVQPICTPTRSVLMTGRYSIHTGCEHILFGASEPSCLPVDLPIMPQAFKLLQYQTREPDLCTRAWLRIPDRCCWRRACRHGRQVALGLLQRLLLAMDTGLR